MHGIIDYDKKVSAIAILLGSRVAPTPLSIISQIRPVDPKLPGSAKDIQIYANKKYADTFRKWKKHTPSEGHFKFIEEMLDKAEIVGLMPETFIKCDFEKFLGFTSPEKRPQLSALSSDQLHHDSNWYSMTVSSKISAEDICNSLRNSERIEHKYCYLTPQSVARWYEFISEDNYPLYEKCLGSLKRFLLEPSWSDFLCDHNTGGAVILGGGAPSKDKRILSSVMRERTNNKNFMYSIVDLSHYMLQETKHALECMVTGHEDVPSVSVIVSDFFNLPLKGPRIRPEGKNVAWFILGNTLGNLDEEMFFKSIRDASRPGDMLIVGNELIPDASSKTLDGDLQKEYELESVQRFFRAPLAAWRDSQNQTAHSEGELEIALRDREVRVIHGCDGNFSRVQNSRTVVVDVRLGAKQINLLKSTRYEYDALCKYVSHYHFDAIKKPSALSNYDLISFMRK